MTTPKRTRTTRRDKGSGTLRQLPNGRWRAYLDLGEDPVDGRRRRVSAVGRTRTEALDRAKAKLLEAAKEDDPTRFDHMPTIGEWCTQWVEDVIRPRRSPNTYRTYETRIRCGIIPAIGRIRVDKIRPSHARLLEKKETEHNSGATARLTQTVLTLALDDAVREGLINRNPLYRMDRPALDPREITPLDPHDACRLIRTEPDPSWRLLWRLMFVTGMRLGEATGITPSEIVVFWQVGVRFVSGVFPQGGQRVSRGVCGIGRCLPVLLCCWLVIWS